MMEPNALHKAIEDALASPGYVERGILVNRLLAATSPLHVNERLLYRSVYTIFRALPDRLVPGTTLDVATTDLPEGGIEILWEGKERLGQAASNAPDLREVLGHGPHGDLVEIALLALEKYCNMHAGYMDTYREVTRSSSFERPPHVVRRVLAVIPGPTHSEATRARAPDPRPGEGRAPNDAAALDASRDRDARRARLPAPAANGRRSRAPTRACVRAPRGRRHPPDARVLRRDPAAARIRRTTKGT